MNNPKTEREARCYQMLRDPAFEPLIQHWMECRLEIMENLTVAPDEKLVRQLQGQAQMITKILDNIHDAHELVRKLKGR